MQMNRSVTLLLTNRLNVTQVVVLEPWGGEYPLAPGRSFEVVATGDVARPLTIELNEHLIVVTCFDSAGSEMSIFQNGKEILASE